MTHPTRSGGERWEKALRGCREGKLRAYVVPAAESRRIKADPREQVSPTPRLKLEIDRHLRATTEPQSHADIAEALDQHLISPIMYHLATLEREGRASSTPEGYSKVWASSERGDESPGTGQLPEAAA
jgi:hypothetical protein